MFHPVDDFTVERFLNGDVCHGCGGRGAMPMLLVRRKPNNITWPDFLDRTSCTLCASAPGCDDQRLTERMGVPRSASTRFEGDTCATNTCRFWCLEQRINANYAGKPISWPFARRV